MIGNEVLMVVEAVSREKGVEKETIFQAVEAALATATRKLPRVVAHVSR
jgi:N utilization substance protein A